MRVGIGRCQALQAQQLQSAEAFDGTIGAVYNESASSRVPLLYIGLSRLWGRNGFDGDKDSRDACRAPSSRKSGGTQRNCGHAARSRCLIKQRRPPRSRLRGATGCHKSRLVGARASDSRRRDLSGLAISGFRRSSTEVANFQERLCM